MILTGWLEQRNHHTFLVEVEAPLSNMFESIKFKVELVTMVPKQS